MMQHLLATYAQVNRFHHYLIVDVGRTHHMYTSHLWWLPTVCVHTVGSAYISTTDACPRMGHSDDILMY